MHRLTVHPPPVQVKIGAASAAVLATAGASALAPVNLSAFAHQLAYGLWFGSNILVTVSRPALLVHPRS